MVVPAQPRASKRSLAAWRIASRVCAAAAARRGARYGRLLDLTSLDILARVTPDSIGYHPIVAEKAGNMQTAAPGSHAQATYVPAGAHEVWWMDSTVDVKLTAAQTDGHLGMWLWVARRGATAPLHVHHREDEEFLVIDGEVRFIVGDQRLDAHAGDLVFLPREVPHAYLVTSEIARAVGSATPGGFESFFAELGTPVQPGAPAAPPPAIEARAAAAARRGIDTLGPPPTLD